LFKIDLKRGFDDIELGMNIDEVLKRYRKIDDGEPDIHESTGIPYADFDDTGVSFEFLDGALTCIGFLEPSVVIFDDNRIEIEKIRKKAILKILESRFAYVDDGMHLYSDECGILFLFGDAEGDSRLLNLSMLARPYKESMNKIKAIQSKWIEVHSQPGALSGD